MTGIVVFCFPLIIGIVLVKNAGDNKILKMLGYALIAFFAACLALFLI